MFASRGTLTIKSGTCKMLTVGRPFFSSSRFALPDRICKIFKSSHKFTVFLLKTHFRIAPVPSVLNLKNTSICMHAFKTRVSVALPESRPPCNHPRRLRCHFRVRVSGRNLNPAMISVRFLNVGAEPVAWSVVRTAVMSRYLQYRACGPVRIREITHDGRPVSQTNGRERRWVGEPPSMLFVRR